MEKTLNAIKVWKNYYRKAHLLDCCLAYNKSYTKCEASSIRAKLLTYLCRPKSAIGGHASRLDCK